MHFFEAGASSGQSDFEIPQAFNVENSKQRINCNKGCVGNVII